MSTQTTAWHGPGAPPTSSESANKAYRRAWWSLALYPVTFVASFAIGDGILSAFNADTDDPAVWQVLVAGTPALFLLVVPSILAVILGRKAIRLGRIDGRVPAVVGAVIAVGFVVLNVVPYIVELVT